MRWFRRFCRTVLADSTQDLDSALQRHLDQVRTLRGVLVDVLEEVECALSACDTLAARMGTARERLRDQRAARRLDPVELSSEHRQR